MKFNEYKVINTSLQAIFAPEHNVAVDLDCAYASITYAIGDIHGNASKLLHILFYIGIISAPGPVKIGLYSSYNRSGYDDFNSNLQKIIFHKPIINKIKIILTGDTLCDRGNSDFMTLLIYKLLDDNNVNFSICLSNHDSAFVYQMSFFDKIGLFDLKRMPVRPARSFDIGRLPLKDQYKCLDIYKQQYVPRLRIAEHDFSNPSQSLIYTHAPCNYKSIQRILNDKKEISLEDLVKNVNVKLANIISTGTFNYEWIEQNCEDFIWNRDLDIKFTGNTINIFGHIGEINRSNANQINLDTNLGKSHDSSRGQLALYKVKVISNTPETIPLIEVLGNQEQRNISLINVIKAVKTASSGWYSTFGNNRKGASIENILRACINKQLTNSQILRVIHILAKVSLIPRGETTKLSRVTKIVDKNIQKTSSAQALLLQLSTERVLQQLFLTEKVTLKSYEDLIAYASETINRLYLHKDAIYKRSDTLSNELINMTI
tara:strand:+ start:333 stop:1799 length:1467 start_codon:yes stop_codon:yes gene_type:complete